MYSYEQLHYVKAKFAVPAFCRGLLQHRLKAKSTQTLFVVSCPLLEVDEWLTFVINCEPRVSYYMYLKSIN